MSYNFALAAREQLVDFHRYHHVLSPMDLDGVKQESIESEFLAVILAGFGNE